jgi:GGDEF domain-containing protein
LMERLRGSLRTALGGHPIPVTVSVGAVTFETLPATVADMVARADQAMYRAKRAGRGTVQLDVWREPPAPRRAAEGAAATA